MELIGEASLRHGFQAIGLNEVQLPQPAVV
jgi:hypothetical protein